MAAEVVPTIIVPQTEQEAIAQLSATFGQEVWDKMESIGWDPMKTPPAQVPAVNPQPTPAVVTPTPVVTQPVTPPVVTTQPPATTSEPATPAPVKTEPTSDLERLRGADGKFAGKYNTPEALEKGYHNLLQMAIKALEDKDQFKARAEALESRQFIAPTAPSQPPAERATLENTFDRTKAREVIFDALKDKDALSPDDLKPVFDFMEAGITSEAQRIVNEALTKRDKVSTEWNEADAYMAKHYPDSVSQGPEVNIFLKTHPDVNAEVNDLVKQGNRVGALRLAWLSYKDVNGDPKVQAALVEEQRLTAQAQVRQEAVEQARKDAGLIPSSVSTVHTPQPTGPTPEDVKLAEQLYHSGIKEPYLRMRVMGPELSKQLDQLAGLQ